MELAEINFIAVGIGTLAALVIGLIWFSKAVFGTLWHNAMAPGQASEKNIYSTFPAAIVLSAVIGITMSAFKPASITGLGDGLLYGAITGLGLVAAALGISYLFARRSTVIFLIEAGYLLLIFVVFGGVIAYFST